MAVAKEDSVNAVLVALSLFVPIAGFIVGGIGIAKGKGSGVVYVVTAVVGIVLGFIFLACVH